MIVYLIRLRRTAAAFAASIIQLLIQVNGDVSQPSYQSLPGVEGALNMAQEVRRVNS